MATTGGMPKESRLHVTELSKVLSKLHRRTRGSFPSSSRRFGPSRIATIGRYGWVPGRSRARSAGVVSQRSRRMHLYGRRGQVRQRLDESTLQGGLSEMLTTTTNCNRCIEKKTINSIFSTSISLVEPAHVCTKNHASTNVTITYLAAMPIERCSSSGVSCSFENLVV
jgi:hypothetical protein